MSFRDTQTHHTYDKKSLRRLILEHTSALVKHSSLQRVALSMLREVFTWNDDKWEVLLKAFNFKSELVYSDINEVTTTNSRKSEAVFCKVLSSDFKVNNHHKNKVLVFLPTVGRKELIQSIKHFVEAANFAGKKIEFEIVIIFDGQNDKTSNKVNRVCSVLNDVNFSWSIFVSDTHVGYINAMVRVLKENFSSEKFDYIGFLDDDAFLLQENHYIEMIKALKSKDVEAVSGLAVDKDTRDTLHDFFNIGSSYNFLNFARGAKRELSKPHIHGGGGGCLMRAETFRECLSYADTNNTLVGPTVSAIVNSRCHKAVALQNSLVLHKTRSTFFDWLVMVKRYYNSWLQLQHFENYNESGYLNVYQPNLQTVMTEYDEFMYSKYIVLGDFRRVFKHL